MEIEQAIRLFLASFKIEKGCKSCAENYVGLKEILEWMNEQYLKSSCEKKPADHPVETA